MKKPILIIEKDNISHPFKVLLSLDGYPVEVTQGISTNIEAEKYSLLITSDRYLINNYDKIRNFNIPFLVVSSNGNTLQDHIIKTARHAHILNSPVDFKQFRTTVRELTGA
ncbi:MAG TPA: hypothetical protein ENK09_00985 [Nitrospirae bacterium]|nr:hypothetical protein [Nitrospirota bacterium]